MPKTPAYSGPPKLFLTLGTLLVLAAVSNPALAVVPGEVRAVLADHCADCHGSKGKANIDVTSLDKLQLGDRLDVLNNIQDHLFYKMMQPPSAEHPSARHARVLADCVRSSLPRHKSPQPADGRS